MNTYLHCTHDIHTRIKSHHITSHYITCMHACNAYTQHIRTSTHACIRQIHTYMHCMHRMHALHFIHTSHYVLMHYIHSCIADMHTWTTHTYARKCIHDNALECVTTNHMTSQHITLHKYMHTCIHKHTHTYIKCVTYVHASHTCPRTCITHMHAYVRTCTHTIP